MRWDKTVVHLFVRLSFYMLRSASIKLASRFYLYTVVLLDQICPVVM